MSALVLVRVAGPASLQDLGRPGQLHLGLPGGGTLAPTALAALNDALGNPREALGLEVFGLLVARAEGEVVARLDGGETVALEPLPASRASRGSPVRPRRRARAATG